MGTFLKEVVIGGCVDKKHITPNPFILTRLKNMMIALLAAMTVTQANADGFKCEGLNSGTRIQVYNHTDAAAGTRKVAVMVVSDYNVNSPMIMTTTPFHTKVADDSKLVSTFAT